MERGRRAGKGGGKRRKGEEREEGGEKGRREGEKASKSRRSTAKHKVSAPIKPTPDSWESLPNRKQTKGFNQKRQTERKQTGVYVCEECL